MNRITGVAFMVVAGCGLLLNSYPARAASPNNPPDATLSSIAGTAVSDSQLSTLRGGALTVVASGNIGTDSNNSANYSQTGNIQNNQAINNNTGITTIFQNTGNNSLFQSSTTVNITVH
jgi:hypothetical protein